MDEIIAEGFPHALPIQLLRQAVCRCGHTEMIYGATVEELDYLERSWRLFDCWRCAVQKRGVSPDDLRRNIKAAAVRQTTAPLS
jgi:hypothetical protein